MPIVFGFGSTMALPGEHLGDSEPESYRAQSHCTPETTVYVFAGGLSLELVANCV